MIVHSTTVTETSDDGSRVVLGQQRPEGQECCPVVVEIEEGGTNRKQKISVSALTAFAIERAIRKYRVEMEKLGVRTQ